MNEDLNEKLQKLRTDYAMETLDEKTVDKDPIQQSRYWLDEAIKAEVNEPSAMTLATCGTPGCRPTARIVLLKGIEENGFVFFTNYKSRKGKEITDNPQACLNFFWPELQRQIRIEGEVEKISEEASEEYFRSRPFESRVGAIASQQSEELESRIELENRIEALKKEFKAGEVPKPDQWGGYILRPDIMEFWQGRLSRLHDRIQYTLTEKKNWSIKRLYP